MIALTETALDPHGNEWRGGDTILVNPDHIVAIVPDDRFGSIVYTLGNYTGGSNLCFEVAETPDEVHKRISFAR